MPATGRNRKPKRKARVAGFCGIPADGRDGTAHFHDRCAVEQYARRRRPFWDFEEVNFFLDRPIIGHGPTDLEQLKANLIRECTTDLICPEFSRIANGGSAAEVEAFRTFLEEKGIRLHVISGHGTNGSARASVEASPCAQRSAGACSDDQPQEDPEPEGG